MVKIIKGIKLFIFALICMALLFPVWLMLINSFTPAKAFLKTPPSLVPYKFITDNYERVFKLKYLGTWIFNSIIIVVLIVVFGVLVNGAAAYVFAFARFKYKDIIFVALMVPIFVTRYAILISKFMVVGTLKLPGLVAVVSMSIFWPTGIYLFRNYFLTIPKSLIESARIDGANELIILLRIVFPVCKPILGAAIVFLGMGALGDYIWQLLNLVQIETRTFLVGLMLTVLDVYAVKNIGYELAVGTLLFIPYLVIFSFSSKYFIKGLVGGALKE